SFNEMLERLEATQADLETLNQQLEQRVVERTERFRREVERRLEAQEALLSSQARYANLVEQNLAGVYVATPNGKILSANPALARMMRYDSVREFIEFGSIPYLDPLHRRQMAATLAEKGAIMNSEVQLETRDGTTIWALENTRLDSEENQIEGIVLDITERKLSEMEIEYRAHHDPLTGLPNRNLLQDRLFMAINSASRLGHRVAVVFLDVDDLKEINDVLGHSIGDEVLKSIGKRMMSSVRDTDTVARIGGDEFVVVFPNLLEDQSIETLTEKLRQSLREPVVIDNEQILVKASMGIAVFPSDGHDPETLIQNADSMMYRVKLKGGDGIRTYSDGESSHGLRRSSLEGELRNAIETGELVAWYQPQFDLGTLEMTGVEALARWIHPEGAVIQPSGFIPLAERTGLILPLGELVLRKGCEDLRRWQQTSPNFQLAVNVSARQFHQQNFLDMVTEVIANQNVDPSLVELEITESLAIQKSGWTIELLNRLRRIGVRIAVDDFGTGQSSLTYLKNYPIDTVKIDKEFIRGMLENPHDHSIVTAILLLSESLGLRTVAEGIETEQQLEYLCEHGCGHGQGYHFARAMPATDIDALLAKGTGDAPAGAQSSADAAPAEGSTSVASPLTASTTDPYEKNEP
ncbi:MAG: bifunctional diguanylate cyclase/phosphodiesterase, partial [Acidobacteria bacterium]|nr:bifunctional diguanylate cyclase/phosphodiesterase [Acidobacteriota bacterium]